ncbi:MAG: Stp1/IreP family PP2C-type Ser/Thr phosphatase [Lachnospiraceae bacterium]|nr:Stp1/IreP family PP2C-type Ser/Thr phosphatase [Lachnospiraceae bacterium]
MLKAFSITDVGKKRQVNEDCVCVREESVGALPNFFIVADGMGGHKAGDRASQETVEIMLNSIECSQEKDPRIIMRKALDEANLRVFCDAYGSVELEGMGTTVVAATVIDKTLYVMNVGDSRLYLMNAEGIRQVTVDHSLVEELVRKGVLAREKARNHPKKNIITRAVGVMTTVEPDFFVVELNAGDKVLLCSDGLSNMLEDEELLKIGQAEGTLEERARLMVDEANGNGGKDNISVILIEIPAE